MDKVLITGATGLLGTTLVPYLKKCENCVVTHARRAGADFLVDLDNRDRSFEFLTQVQPSVIVNLAGLTSVELCQEEPNSAYLANTRTVENLAEWLLQSGAACHLIQISTDQVYDGVGPHAEDQVTLTNYYAFSKYAGELAADRVPSTILRTNFIGRSKLSNRESLTDWVYASLTSRKSVQVLRDVLFSPLSMNTLGEMIQLVIAKRPTGVFNLGSQDGMSKADFDFAFAERLGLATSTMSRIDSGQATFLKAYRPKDMRMDCSKFENVLGVKLPLLSDELNRVAKEYHEFT
ncbi:MAG: SDR family oxidoreductase [Burkholderiales bacterium]|nr:SDR family oxidoreductase [Burkholderiales bacterium]